MGLDTTITGDDHRSLGRLDEAYELADRGRLADITGHRCREVHLLEHRLVDHLLLDVVRNTQQHRGRLRRVQCPGYLIEYLADVIGALDQLAVTGYAAVQLGLIDRPSLAGTLLQTPAPEDVGRGLAGDRQHRQLLGKGVGDAGYQVRRTRAGGGNTRRRAVREACVAAGHERRALFVFDQHGIDRGMK